MRTEALETISPFRGPPTAKGPQAAAESGAANGTKERFALPEEATIPERENANGVGGEVKAAAAGARAAAGGREGAPGQEVMRAVLAVLAEQGRGKLAATAGKDASEAAVPEASDPIAPEGTPDAAADVSSDAAQGLAPVTFDPGETPIDAAPQPGEADPGIETPEDEPAPPPSASAPDIEAAPAEEASPPAAPSEADDAPLAGSPSTDEPSAATPAPPADAAQEPPIVDRGPFGGPMAGGRRGEGPPEHANAARSGRDWSPPGLSLQEGGQPADPAAGANAASDEAVAKAVKAATAIGAQQTPAAARFLAEGAAAAMAEDLAEAAPDEDAAELAARARPGAPGLSGEGLEKALEALRDASGKAAPQAASGEGARAAAPNLANAMQALSGLAEAAAGKGQGAPAPTATPAPTPTVPPPLVVPNAPLGAVPIEIGLKALAGVNHFQIRLDPAELGRIDVNLEIDSDGNVKARLVVDRVETLTLLQREARTLDRALEQAGLKPSDAGVDLSLRDQPREERRGARQEMDDMPNERGRGPDEAEARRVEPVVIQRTLWRGATGVDVRI